LNYYVIVEGVGDKVIYSKWVKYVNPSYRVVNSIDEVQNQNIYIIMGGGQPYILEMIEAGLHDVNDNSIFDYLVVAVDSENMDYQEKKDEIVEYIEACQKSNNVNVDYKVIIQHYCIETWALGNRAIMSRHTTNTSLKEYKDFFDVSIKDPELLPVPPSANINRAHFAFDYLKRLLNEKYRNLGYSKGKPSVMSTNNCRIKS